jgi:Mor family transcriptional regulator
VAPRPPRPKLTTLARRANKKIIYLPIGQLSPAKIRKIRVFHVLEGRRVRAYAPEYVGD